MANASEDEGDMSVDGTMESLMVDPYLCASMEDDDDNPDALIPSPSTSVDPYISASVGDVESSSFTASPDKAPSLTSTPQPSLCGTTSTSPARTSTSPATSLQNCKESVVKGFEAISRLTAIKRLNRMVRPRVDGSFAVPEELVTQYKQASTKEDVIAEFIKCGGLKELAQ